MIAGAAGQTCDVSFLSGQFLAALAHPADAPRGHAHHQCVGSNITRNHSTGTDESIFADGMPTHDGRIGTDGGATPNVGRLVFVFTRNVASWIDDVGEHHARAAENVIFENYVIVDRNVVLHLDVIAIKTLLPTKTFWPKEQPVPILAPPQICTQCQTRVPSPICAPSSTMAVGWMLAKMSVLQW